MATLLEILSKEKHKVRQTECSTKKWLDTLSEEELDALMDCINDPSISISSLYNSIAHSDAGIPFKLTAFRSHMRGYCVCQKN